MKKENARFDHRAILEMIAANSTVLDLGCGNGELLCLLRDEKNVRGQGIEINEQAIYKCVESGLSVLHGDLDSGLSDYRDEAFDYVVLNQSFQQIRQVEQVLFDALRVGKKVIVGFPNFTFYKARLQLFFLGRTPVIGSLPYQWFETPNLHFLSISDFIQYCGFKKITIEKKVFLNEGNRIVLAPNLFAQVGIFLLSRAR